MSTENQTPDDTTEVSLDDFSAEFFGQDKAAPEETKPEVDEVTNDGTDAEPEDTQDDTENDDTDDGDATNDEEDEEAEKQTEETPKPKTKNRFQDRIDELTAKAREAERREQAANERLAAIEARLTPETPAPKPATAAEGPTPPKPTDVLEDGAEKYPLGEFDPQFITDLAGFQVEQKFAARDQQWAEEARASKAAEAQTQLQAGWNTQVADAQERYPDFTDKAQELSSVFVNLDEAYGEYLGNTLMSMEKGTDVLYYLANNPDEALKIANSGAQRATIALGRLEAQFADEQGEPVIRKKVTTAPVPPPQTRGSSAARGRVAPDTDDLDAFAGEFFNRK